MGYTGIMDKTQAEFERARQMKLCVYTAILVHVLVLQISTITEVPASVVHDEQVTDWRGLVFVDATELPDIPSHLPDEDTRLISQKNYREADRTLDDTDKDPASPDERTDSPRDPSDADSPTDDAKEDGLGRIALDDRGRLAKRAAAGEGTVTPGEIIYNIKRHEYADYYKHIRDRVLASWEARYSHDLHKLLRTHYRATVLFRVERAGEIRGVRPGPDQTRNLELVTKLMQVIRNAGPLDSFPEKITEPYLPIRFDFYFF
jgi:hypothetical protein